MSSLYELTQDVMYLQALLEEGEIDDGVYADSIESLCVDDKIENICKVMKNLEAKAAAYKAEIDRMNARKKTLENGVERLKESIKNYMVLSNSKKIEAGLFTVSLGKSKSVSIWDETGIPEEFLIHQPSKVNKAAISKALKAGEIVAGAELVENAFITIK